MRTYAEKEKVGRKLFLFTYISRNALTENSGKKEQNYAPITQKGSTKKDARESMQTTYKYSRVRIYAATYK